MTPFECPFEDEALAAVEQCRWPERVDAALREHIAVCPVCGDVIRVAQAFDGRVLEDRAAAAVPDAGRVWWMAQLRARFEDTQAAGRPITAVQVIAFTCSLALLGACFGATSGWFQAVLGRAGAYAGTIDWRALVSAAAQLLSQHTLLAAIGAAILLIVPTALVLAFSRD
jgi:hypothetical protein